MPPTPRAARPARGAPAPRPATGVPWPGVVIPGVLVLCALGYGSVVGTFFLSDDFILLKVVSAGWPAVWEQIAASGSFIRPLWWLSIDLDFHLWGLDPIGYHLTNIALHGLTAIVVVVLAQALGTAADPSRDRLLAVGTGALFAVLHSHTEAVTWIAGRVDILTALFYALGLLGYVRYRTGGSPLSYAVALLGFVGAAASKEAGVTFPLVATAYELLFHRADARALRRRMMFALAGLYAVLVGYLLIRVALLGTPVGGYGAETHLHFSDRVFRNIYRYFGRIFIPYIPDDTAAALHGLFSAREPSIKELAAYPIYVIWAALVIAVVALWRRARGVFRQPAFQFAGVAFLLSILPMINLGVVPNDTEGERFLYLPSVFACLMVAPALAGLSRQALTLVLPGVSALSLAILMASNANWAAAARITRSVVLDAPPRHPAETVIATLPDNLNGAYVFRNGLPEAWRVFHPGAPAPVLLTTHYAFSADDPIDVAQRDGRTVIRLAHPRSRLALRPDTPPPAGLEVAVSDERELMMRVAAPTNLTELVYRAGRLEVIAPAP